MDNSKHKGISNALAVLLVFLIMAGVAVAIYFVSARVSQQQAIAPTAPESEPLAAKKVDPGKGKVTPPKKTGTGCCKDPDKCKDNEVCNSSCVCKKKVENQPTPTGYSPVGGCFGKGKSCSKGLCCTCDSRDPVTKNCVGGSNSSYCTSCNNPSVDTIKCGQVECDAGSEVCCPSGCKPKSQGCPTPPPTCVDTTWRPDPGQICPARTITQTSNCGNTRQVRGTNEENCGTCSAVSFFVPEDTQKACTAHADCTSTSLPEGSFCNPTLGKCVNWVPVSLAELPTRATVGRRVKASFTATNTDSVEVNVNNTDFVRARKNTATGKFDYIFTISAPGTFNVRARYVKI